MWWFPLRHCPVATTSTHTGWLSQHLSTVIDMSYRHRYRASLCSLTLVDTFWGLTQTQLYIPSRSGLTNWKEMLYLQWYLFLQHLLIRSFTIFFNNFLKFGTCLWIVTFAPEESMEVLTDNFRPLCWDNASSFRIMTPDKCMKHGQISRYFH